MPDMASGCPNVSFHDKYKISMEIKIYMQKELGTWNAVVPSSFSKTGIWNLERVPFLPWNLERVPF